MFNPATSPALPPSVQEANKRRCLELEQLLVAALKAQQFPQALVLANQVLALQPGNVRVQQFQTLLQEKEHLAQSSSEEEEEEDDAPAGAAAPNGGGAAAAGEGEDDEDSSDDDSSDEDDEDDDEEDDTSTQTSNGTQASASASTPAITLTADELAAGMGAIALDPHSYSHSRAWRAKLRRDLTAEVKTLRQKERMAKMIADDPLLGA